MGFIDSLFGSKSNTVTQEPMMPDWQLQTGQDLSKWIQSFLQNYAPGAAYTGDFTAGLTDQEKTSLNQLTSFMNQPTSTPLLEAGNQQLLDTLGGKYIDPNTSPYIQSMIKLSGQNLQDSINQERATRGARGTYFTKAGVNAESQLQERSLNNLNAIVGDFVNQERNRILQSVPMAQSMDQYSTMTKPLATIEAGQTYGSLERQLAQNDLENQYQDFLRQRQELSGLPSFAQGLYGTNVPYGIQSVTTKSPSTFMRMLGEISPGVGSYNTAKYGYTTNQSSLADSFSSQSGADINSIGSLLKLLMVGGL